MPLHKGLVRKLFLKRSDFVSWLKTHHEQEEGVWITFAKKASSKKSISYEQAREVAITYGWIDGLRNSFDDDYYLMKFTKRRKRSKWSMINRQIAEELIRKKKMRAAGMRQVKAAQQEGRWEAAYPSSATIEEPDDFLNALDRNEAARSFYQSISRANRYAILIKIFESQRPDTRERRISKYIAMLEKAQVPHPGF